MQARETRSGRPPGTRAVTAAVGARLVRSSWVQRLGRISFLGTLDFHPGSTTASTRLEHSLGVARLGVDMAAALELDHETTRSFVAACLLHDIGHFPLSHAAEPGFARALGVAHHGVSEWIILGNGPIPASLSLRPLLEAEGLDPELVWSLITGDARLGPLHRSLSRLLLAPINLDTLDGIVRAARAFGIRGVRVRAPLFSRRGDAVAIRSDALPLLDRFWALKDRVYCDVINLPSNIVCEARLSAAVARRYDRAIFGGFERFDDRVLAPVLDEHLRESGLLEGRDGPFQFRREDDARANAALHLRRARKRYYVDRSVLPRADGLPLEQWSRRYRHERQVMYLVPRRATRQLALPGLARADEPPIPGFSAVDGPDI
ncbi:MAG: HD domain-containing protein [Myxococcales bacterium]|nr:HD domain-containing protein [Myxococcales bacterium]